MMKRHKKSILVLGGSGLVGSRFVELSQHDFSIIAPLSSTASLDDPTNIEETIQRYNPDIVVNFAAYTNVDQAENERGNEQGGCWQTNVAGVKNLAHVCKKNAKKLIQISTDFVFDGQHGPYTEDDLPMTSEEQGTWYGWTKLQGEKVIQQLLGDFIIVRVAYPFRAQYDPKPDFVQKIVPRLKTGTLYPLFTDQKISPTFIDDLVDALHVLIATEATGIYHVATNGHVSPYTAACDIADVFGFDKHGIKEGSLNTFLEQKKDVPYAKVRYAKSSSLNVEKINTALMPQGKKMHTFKEALQIMKDQIEDPLKQKVPVILLTGGTGLLGTALLETAPEDYIIIPTYFSNFAMSEYKGFQFHKMDITNKDDVAKTFETFKPTVVIHAASIGNVDYCEQHPDEADKVNVEGTKHMIDACKMFDAKLIFTSSNAIFDGNHAPYTEDSKPNPVNYYGKTKMISEEQIQAAGINYVIIRLLLMYGWNHPQERGNPVTWLIDKLSKGEEVKMVNDVYVNPLYNIQAAQAVWKIVETNKQGIYNLAGQDRVNRYELAINVAEVFGLPKGLIGEVDSDFFKGLAKRMPDTTFDVSKMEHDLNIRPLTLAEGLQHMKEHNEQFRS